jgi:hypothetical protein
MSLDEIGGLFVSANLRGIRLFAAHHHHTPLYRLPLVRPCTRLEEQIPVAATRLKMHMSDFVHAQLFYDAVMMSACVLCIDEIMVAEQGVRGLLGGGVPVCGQPGCLVLARIAKTGPALIINDYR